VRSRQQGTGDANGNWNPVFKVITWVPASRFVPSIDVPQIEAKPGPVVDIEAIEAASDPPIMEGSRLAKIIDDEIPF
jgi:hypothetical protein